MDSAGSMRSYNTIDHGGYGGTEFVIDPSEGLSYAIFTVALEGVWFNYCGAFTNVLYSALI